MKKNLQQRVLEALVQFPDGKVEYHTLMYKLWPPVEYPRAYRRSYNGGPPRVAMVFGRALSDLHIKGLISRFNDRRQERYGQHDIWITSSGRKLVNQ